MAATISLPALKFGSTYRQQSQTYRHLVTPISDYSCEQDDMTYLVSGQGAQYPVRKRGVGKFFDAIGTYDLKGESQLYAVPMLDDDHTY